jgi:hypothetical protein
VTSLLATRRPSGATGLAAPVRLFALTIGRSPCRRRPAGRRRS